MATFIEMQKGLLICSRCCVGTDMYRFNAFVHFVHEQNLTNIKLDDLVTEII